MSWSDRHAKKRANGAIVVMLKNLSDRHTHAHTQTDRHSDGYPVAELFSTVLETMGLASGLVPIMKELTHPHSN